MQDQAEKLRMLVQQTKPKTSDEDVPSIGPCRVISITSGKGGVGKTNVSVNFAIAMANEGNRVLLFDADMGLANIDVLLGMIPKFNLVSVLQGKKLLKDIIVNGPAGVKFIASGSGGVQELADLDEKQRDDFLSALLELQNQTDIILIDTGAGLNRNVLSFVLASSEVVIVTTPEPTALMDAYGMIKTLNRERKDLRINVVVNIAHNQQEADEAGTKLVILAKRFLDMAVNYVGFIPYDPMLVRSVKEQKPILLLSPMSQSAIAFSKLAKTLISRQTQEKDGLVGFFKKISNVLNGKLNG